MVYSVFFDNLRNIYVQICDIQLAVWIEQNVYIIRTIVLREHKRHLMNHTLCSIQICCIHLLREHVLPCDVIYC